MAALRTHDDNACCRNGGLPRTVVIAIDESECSEFAFDYYVDNVHRDGDRISLVHVPEYHNLVSTSALLTDPNVVAELIRDTEESTRRLVERYSFKMKEAHLSGHVKTCTGKTGEAIVEASRSEDATLLVLGTRGMGRVRRTFLGSISDYCVHHSHIPVLVCRHKHHKDHKDHKDHKHGHSK